MFRDLGLRLSCTLLAGVVLACGEAANQPDATSLLAGGKVPIVVTTLAEWQQAIVNAKNADEILVQGTIDIAGGDEVFLMAAGVTIGAASTGSGLHGVSNATGDPPFCLICLGETADHTTVERLTLTQEEGSDAFDTTPIYPGGTSRHPVRGLTIRDNHSICNRPCFTHVFLANTPDATVTDNTFLGQPTFSAVQVQFTSRAAVVDNWIEHAGPSGGVRVVFGDDALVKDNTIAAAARDGIIARLTSGATFRDNKILAVTDPGAPSCTDETLGSGTAGTANTWKDNQAPVPSNPVGICGPRP